METFINALRGVLLGKTVGGELLGFMIWGIIGASLYLMIKVYNRDKSKNANPKPWSWVFFFWDNAPRMAITLTLVFIWSTWGGTISKWLPDSIQEAGGFIYLCIGFFTDIIVVAIGKIRILLKEQVNRWIYNKFGRSDGK